MSNKSVFDKIFDWYLNGTDFNHQDFGLTDAQAAAVERWDFIDNAIRRHRPNLSMAKVQKMWVKKFNLSDRQFWVDLKNSDRLFGSIRTRDKENLRYVRAEWLERIASKAEAKGDFDAAVKALKEANEIDGLRRDNQEGTGIVQPNTYQQPLVIMHTDGRFTTTSFMLDDLLKLPKEEQEKIFKMADAQYADVKEMAKLIEESKPSSD